MELEVRSPNTVWVPEGSSGRKLAGRWTMVYDEGFEVTVGERVFFAFSAYKPA